MSRWLNTNEIQIPYDLFHNVLIGKIQSIQSTHNSVKYEVIWKCEITLPNIKLINQYLCSILDLDGT